MGLPGWNALGTGSSSKKPKDLGTFGPRDSQPVYTPPSGAGADPAGATPGTYDVNPFDPYGTAKAAQEETSGLLGGLKNVLFGLSNPDSQGKHGGVLGDVPVIGDAGRFTGEVAANAGGALASVPGRVADAVGGALEHVDISGFTGSETLQRDFDALPDGEEKQAALAAIKNDPGATGHYMSQAVKQYKDAISQAGLVRPDLTANLVQTPASAADAVSSLLGILGLGQRFVERGISGAAKADGMNRLQAIRAVAEGRASFQSGGVLGSDFLGAEGGLSPVESVAYQKNKSGEWTDDETLDFLASHGSGLSHNPYLQVAGTIATDPANAAGLGSAGLARTVALGARVEKLGVAGTRGQELARLVYKTYEPLQQLQVDRAAKVARTIIDPLSGMSLGMPGRKQVVDLMSETGTKTVIGAYGDIAHLQLVEKLADITPGASKPVLDMFTEDIGTYSANLIRRVVANHQRGVAIANGMGDALVKTGIDDAIDDMVHSAPKSFQEQVLREANRQRIRAFDETALGNLADRLASEYGVLEASEWRTMLDELNEDQLSMLHAATYGRATKRLLAAVEQAKLAGAGGKLSDKLDRIILINRTTLTRQGAEGILSRLKSAGTIEKRTAEFEAAQKLYPELRGVTLDVTNPGRSITRFEDELARRAESYPMQVVDEELADLTDELRDLQGNNAFTLGFAPEDEFKWGLERINEAGGKYAPVTDVWVDHVAPGLAMGYRGARRHVVTNVRGQPIIGAAKALLKPIDYIDAGIQTMSRRISGTIIAESARAHFKANAVKKYGASGITDEVAEQMIAALDDAVAMQDIVVRPSGLSTTQMWKAVEDFIPRHINRSEFGKRELLDLVLDAYQGDMRFVGVTQALSSRIKRVLAFEGNNASVLAEQMYPNLKFRLNVIFQAQEKIEPFILNAFRGVTPARSRKLSEADKATATLLEKMTQNSLVANADHEMQEYTAAVLHGTDIEKQAAASNTALGRMSQKLGIDWGAIRDVKGVKRANMLRTFRKGLGKDLKAVWEQHHPGMWQDMFEETQRNAGRLMDEDEFAVSIMAEHMLGNDVIVKSIEGRVGALARQFDKVDYRAAIMSDMYSPATLGELRTLDLDSMAELMAFPVGRAGAATKTQADIRSAIAAGKLTIEDVKRGLRGVNANADYIARVESALTFSWTGFWSQVRHDFNLSAGESRKLETMIANAAELRNMTPIDYISQVLSPTIVGGEQAVVGHLGKLVEVMRGNVQEVPDVPRALSAIKSFGDDVDWEIPVGAASKVDAEWRFIAKESGVKPELAGKIEKVSRTLPGDVIPQVRYVARDEAGRPAGILDFSEPTPGRIGAIQLVNVRPDARRAGVATSLYDQAIADGYDIMSVSGQTVTENGKKFLAGYKPYTERTRRIGGRPEVEPSLGKLAVLGDGAGTPDQLIAQLSDIFSAHLDPSAKRGLLLAFDPELRAAVTEGRIRLDLAEIDQMWNDTGNSELAKAIMAGVNASPSDLLRAGLPRTADEYRAYFPSITQQVKDGNGKVIIDNQIDVIGPGLANHPDTEFRDALIEELARVRAQFPDVPMARIDVMDLSLVDPAAPFDTVALTIGTQDETGTILLGQYHYGEDWRDAWADAISANEAGRNKTEFFNDLGIMAPRESNVGVGFSADVTPANTLLHEFGHIIDMYVGKGGQYAGKTAKARKNAKRFKAYNEFVKKFDGSPAQRSLSEYANASPEEAMGELWSVALEDTDDFSRFDIPIDPEDAYTGYEPLGPDDLPDFSGDGPQTVQEAVEELRRIADEMGIRKALPAPSQDPDVIRATQMFGKWTSAVIGANLRDANSPYADVLEKIAGIPTYSAVPYNFTEHMLMSGAVDAMKSKWEDAHRLQYYARQRTMLERSVNHPMFGIYPASYMWGKMLPEMVRFVAKEPFGIRTGAAAYSINDAQRAVALQREFDPEFDERIEKAGHSPAMYALGYMMPAYPWEVNANWPAWVRAFGQQGLDLQSRVEGGANVEDEGIFGGISVKGPGERATDMLNPFKPIERTILEPAEQLSEREAPEATTYGTYSGPSGGPVGGTELGDPLGEAMQALRGLLDT